MLFGPRVRYALSMALVVPALVGAGGAPTVGHSVLRSAEQVGSHVVYSSNWSGYAAKGGTFHSVSAAWVEPKVTCGSSAAYSAFWVGLDGYSSNSVEQTGSEADCIGGQPQYSAWYEMYPNPSINLKGKVKPGDHFSASVTASGSKFTLSISDTTQGWKATEVKTLSGAKKSSAEVIAEAPCCTAGGGILPLADFGTVKFTAATVDGESIGSLDPVAIDIGTKAKPKDQTSALTGGTAFSVKWV